MNLKWAISTSLTLVATCALAQPLKIQDRHPAYADDPAPIVAKPVVTEIIHTFEQRWEPVHMLLEQQRRRLGLTPPPPPPFGAPVPAPAPIRPLPLRAEVSDRARSGDVCARHGMTKTYVDKHRWRCKR